MPVFILEHEPVLSLEILLKLSGWTPDEKKRICKFVSAEARTSWCISRILARSVVSFFSDVKPELIVFSLGEKGKPYLGGSKLDFNWSHATGCVALAISAFFDVGIDIEHLGRSNVDYADIARHFFNKDEADWVEAVPLPEAWLRFLSLFVQKEAVLKAGGEGLSGSLAEAPAIFGLPPLHSGASLLFRAGQSEQYLVAVRTLERREQGGQKNSSKQEADFSVTREKFDPMVGFSVQQIFPGLPVVLRGIQ